MNSADNAMNDAGAATAPTEAGRDAFLDLRVHYWTETERILIIIFEFFVLLLCAGCLRLLPFGWVAGLFLPVVLLVVGTMVLIGYWIRHYGASHAISQMSSAPVALGDDAGLFFLELARTLEAKNYRLGLRLAAARIAEIRPGLTVRYHVAATPTAVEPIALNFEPCPIDEVHPTFRGIAVKTEDVNDADERSEFRRLFRRAWSLGVFSTGMLLHTLVYAVPEAWQSRMITTNLLISLGILAVFVAIQYWTNAPTSRAFLVPAGLVDRGPRWLLTARPPHLFRARDSILIAYPMMGEKWGWTVADSARTLSGVGTELEIRTLLRAWLSPLAPPTTEMIRELAGE